MPANLATKTPGQTINEMPSGVFTTLLKTKHTGAIQARRSPSGEVVLYWRYSIGTYSERVRIGVYDASAPPRSITRSPRGFSVAAAVAEAERMAVQHHDHAKEGGRPALLAAQQRAKAETVAAQKQAELAAAESRTLIERYSLLSLLIDYCDHLESLGRRSHKDARSIFNLHVFEPWPEVSALPANKVTMEQIADMMRRTLELGKGRTANKLRSYVRAAYQTAKASRSKASIPVKFKGYSVTHNPAADTSPDESANKPDKHPLTLGEMRTYWQRIKHIQGFKGAVLRLHLLTGSQRIQQLVCLRTADANSDSITLFDGKGRPGTAPRPHCIPLPAEAKAALKQCAPQGEFAISTDGGATHLGAVTLSKWAVEAVGDAIPGFQTKRLRSGVETLLACERVSSEIRGRLQSHGIAGVQSRHYDGHDYMTEKREALNTLYRALQPSKRTPGALLKNR